MSKRRSTPAQSDVCICAQEIDYKYDSSGPWVLASDFEIHKEPPSLSADGQTVYVRFNGTISAEAAIKGLRKIITQIERAGLPRTFATMPRTIAELIIDMDLGEEAPKAFWSRIPDDVASRLLKWSDSPLFNACKVGDFHD